MLYRLSFVLCCLLGSSSVVLADIIYRIELKPGSDPVESLDVRLFDEATPVTVTNFLNYVNGTTANGGSYDDLFIQRFARTGAGDDFVIQAGQFTFNPAVGDGSFSFDSDNDIYPGGLQEVTRDDAIRSEAGISNVRGTIAMALLGGDPDSGTNQWFINLIDNDGSGSVDLDAQDFTVFGEIQGTGMTTLDGVLARTPPVNQGSVVSNLNELPLFDFTIGDTIDESKLLTVPSFTELMTLTGELDFGAVLTGMSSQLTATVTNTGTSAVTLGAIGGVDALVAPFNLDAEDCASVTLNPTDSCTLDISYNPTVIGDPLVDLETDSIDIALATFGYSYTLTVRGVGVAALNPVLVATPTSLDFGDVPLTIVGDQLSELLLQLDNQGSANITVSSVTLSGADAAEFVINEDCVSSSPFSPTNSCSVFVEADPVSLGSKTADLVIVSNDPGSPFTIPITANVVPRVAEITPELTEIDFGIVSLPEPFDPTIAELFRVENTGNVQVSVSDINIVGSGAAEFDFQQECIPASPLDPAETCRIQVVFNASTTGDFSANLEIISDATVSPLIIPISGSVAVDTDGVPDSVEDANSNSGDGNNDGVPDSQQASVASLTLDSGLELTLQTESSIDFTDVEAVPASMLATPPDGVTFTHGGLRFGLSSVPASSADVGIILPPGYIVQTMYVFGPTTGDPTPQWYRFDFDPADNTGVFPLGSVTYTSPAGSATTPEGSTLNREVSIARFVDGVRGDNDLTVNSDVSFEGALIITQVSEDSSSMDPALLAGLFILLMGGQLRRFPGDR